MRIWILSSELVEDAAGGIARYVDTLSRLLGATGHEITVVARSNRVRDELVAPGVHLIGIVPRHTRLADANPTPEPDTHPAYPYNIMDYWAAFSYQLAQETSALLQKLPPPDIIEAQEYAAVPYYLIQRKLTDSGPLERIPILVHLHTASFDLARLNQEDHYRFPLYWTGQMEKFCIHAADGLLSPSRFMAQHIQEALQPPQEIEVVPYPLAQAPEKGETGLPGGSLPNKIVFTGRLEIRKGVLPLLKACSRLWEAGCDFQLELVGGDTAYPAQDTTVAAYIRQNQARWIASGRLLLSGQLDYTDALKRMRSARAVVVPSLWENFPNVCMEAMQLGQVVLVSRAGGQAEMVERDGENGLIFDWDQPGSFEAKLEQALNLTEAERQRMGANARARIHSLCDPEQIVARRVEHYERLVASHKPRRIFPVPAASSPAHPELVPARRKAPPETASLLSIVIPFHNLGPYLPEALQSARQAACEPYEIIIVDDGSNAEDSLALLQQIEAERDMHLRIIHTPNCGLASARNTGAQAARGEWLTFLDADDRVDPTYYRRALSVLQRYENVDFVYSWERFFGSATGIWPTWNAEFPYLLGHNMLPAFAVVRRQVFLKFALNKPEIEYSLEDHESWINLLAAGGVGVSLPDPLVGYRVRSGSMLRSANARQRRYLHDLISRLHPDIYRQFGPELFNLLNANGPSWRWNHPALEVQEISPDYVRDLEETRDRLWQEVQALGAAWHEQDRYIKQQNERLAGFGSETGARLGGRLTRRVLDLGIIRFLLRLPGVKPFLKRLIGY